LKITNLTDDLINKNATCYIERKKAGKKDEVEKIQGSKAIVKF
jgi:hypothetical protein